MKLKIKRFDKSIPLPSYKTSGATCLDLYCRTETTIQPHSVGYIPQNIAIEMPKGYWGMLALRSSAHKRGLLIPNGIGICDSDYAGNNDEYTLIVYNFTDNPVTIEKGARIAQVAILPVEYVDLIEVDQLDTPSRGGIGSTGK